jgi:hypothetical protein
MASESVLLETPERRKIVRLFRQLCDQPVYPFPKSRQTLSAPCSHGVYVIRDPGGHIVHVGRTLRRKDGLQQRLRDHLCGSSTFVKYHLAGRSSQLRAGYTFQCLEVVDARARALLEAFATAWLCPIHLGLGEATD